MNFEEALRDELSSINSLSEKVFPLNADEGTQAPYIIYVSSEGIQQKTFEGFLNTKEISCEINILHNSYPEMKELTKVVLLKVISFQGRTIGNEGPYVQNLNYQSPVEIYEKEVKLYRSVIDIKVRF